MIDDVPDRAVLDALVGHMDGSCPLPWDELAAVANKAIAIARRELQIGHTDTLPVGTPYWSASLRMQFVKVALPGVDVWVSRTDDRIALSSAELVGLDHK